MEINKILNLNQHGILLTQQNGHWYATYERDIEMSPTSESKWLLERMSERGVSLREKWYDELDVVVEKIENFMDWLVCDSDVNDII